MHAVAPVGLVPMLLDIHLFQYHEFNGITNIPTLVRHQKPLPDPELIHNNIILI